MKTTLAFSLLLTSPLTVLGTFRGLSSVYNQDPDDLVSRELQFGDWIINTKVNNRANKSSLRQKLGQPNRRNGWKQPGNIGNNNDNNNNNKGNGCNNNGDCGEDAYCAAGNCLDMGKCNDVFDCRNPSNVYMTPACVGHLFCNNNSCGKNCGSACEDASDGTECPVEPCSVTSETCRGDFVSCSNDNCGGCNALVFNQRGDKELCPTQDGVVALPIPPQANAPATPCESTSDCSDLEYCASGVCLEEGACNSNLDCFNPDNNYSVIMCVGPILCFENALCGRECET